MTRPRHDTISFLSDYGPADEFVGVVKSVIRQIAPERRWSSTSPTTCPPTTCGPAGSRWPAPRSTWPPGVVLAVVDPGVGTDRRAVAVEVGDGDVGARRPRQRAAGAGGGHGRRRRPGPSSSPTPSTTSQAPGPTFDGRDVFAPAAAHLCRGVPLEELGPEIDPVTLLPGHPPAEPRGGRRRSRPRCCGSTASATCSSTSTPTSSRRSATRVRRRSDRRVGPERAAGSRAFADAGPGEIGLVVDSYGLLRGRARPALGGRGARPRRRRRGAASSPCRRRRRRASGGDAPSSAPSRLVQPHQEPP